MKKSWPKPWPGVVVLLQAWNQITKVDWAHGKANVKVVGGKEKHLQKRWVVFSPDYTALAYYQDRPEIFGEINSRHVRVLLGAIRKLNEIATPKNRKS